MNCTSIKISVQMFKTIVEVGRMMKSTFIVYDPENPMQLYGFNGIGYEWNGETKLGCMKYIDNLEYIDFLRRPESKYPVHGFVCYVKDLYASSKLLDESNLNNNEINEERMNLILSHSHGDKFYERAANAYQLSTTDSDTINDRVKNTVDQQLQEMAHLEKLGKIEKGSPNYNMLKNTYNKYKDEDLEGKINLLLNVV